MLTFVFLSPFIFKWTEQPMCILGSPRPMASGAGVGRAPSADLCTFTQVLLKKKKGKGKRLFHFYKQFLQSFSECGFFKATACCSNHLNGSAKWRQILYDFCLSLKGDVDARMYVLAFLTKAQLYPSWEVLSWGILRRAKRYVLLQWSSLRWTI